MPRLTRPLTTLTLLATVALAGAGCGADGSPGGGAAGSGSAERSGSTGSTQSAAHAKAIKLAECMRGHGLADFPDPDAHDEFEYGISVSAEVWTAAVEACKRFETPGMFSGRRTPDRQRAALAFAKCIRAHGVTDFPDPVNGDPLVDTTKIPSSNSPGGMTILNAAMQACHDEGTKATGEQQ